MRRRVGSWAQAVCGETRGFGEETVVWRRDRRSGALLQRQRGLNRREGVGGGIVGGEAEKPRTRDVIFVVHIASVL